MRKVILFITLDGFIGGPNGELDWMVADDKEMDKELITQLLSRVDAVLVGWKTYQGFENYWPAVATNPSSPRHFIEFTHWLENAPKIVFSDSRKGWMEEFNAR